MDFIREEILPLTPEETNLPEGELRTWVKDIGDILGRLRNDVYDEFERRDMSKVLVLDVTADYTVLDDDRYTEIHVTTGASAIIITLPELVYNIGRKLRIFKVDSGAGTVIVDGNGSETINGSTTKTITNRYGFTDIVGGTLGWYGSLSL